MSREAERKIARLRKEIDRADRQLISALSKRFEASSRIGEIKMKEGIPILQPSRWSEVLKSRLRLGKDLGLNASLIRQIYGIIHRESLRQQRLRSGRK